MSRFKGTYILVLVMSLPVIITAQFHHFVYLQSENKQPFYVKLDKKVLSSSATGYLIIPKLNDGSYSISVGFPKEETKEQVYTINVAEKDAGYLLKNFGDKGWGLFNLQTMDVAMSGANPAKADAVPAEKSDAFSNMLADAVNDPSIKQADKKPSGQAEPGQQTTAESAVEAKKAIRSVIRRQANIANSKGLEITYVDITGNTQDTIRVFIPAEKEITPPAGSNELNVSPGVEAVNSTAVKQDEPVKTDHGNAGKNDNGGEKKFLPIQVTPAASADSIPAVIAAKTNDCKTLAADEDFLKLRKKMASAENNDEMLSVAQKFFRSKCYSTGQVKNLCVLFLDDAGKYKFFDLAYSYVYDKAAFSSLESQLSEAYYISRFKAMVSQ